MDKLTNKRAGNYDYTCRYTGVPYYYDTSKGKDVGGIGEQIRFDTAYLSHKLRPDDTLDSLALKYYNNPTYWWIIAYFNKLTDPFIQLTNYMTVIKIPAISSIEFKNER